MKNVINNKDDQARWNCHCNALTLPSKPSRKRAKCLRQKAEEKF